MALQLQQQMNQAAANAAAKDPVGYNRLKEAFIQDLHRFHDSKGYVLIFTFIKCFYIKIDAHIRNCVNIQKILCYTWSILR